MVLQTNYAYAKVVRSTTVCRETPFLAFVCCVSRKTISISMEQRIVVKFHMKLGKTAAESNSFLIKYMANNSYHVLGFSSGVRVFKMAKKALKTGRPFIVDFSAVSDEATLVWRPERSMSLLLENLWI